MFGLPALECGFADQHADLHKPCKQACKNAPVGFVQERCGSVNEVSWNLYQQPMDQHFQVGPFQTSGFLLGFL